MRRQQIRSVDPLSAGKVGCLWGLIFAAVLGCFIVFLPGLLFPTMMAPFARQQDVAPLIGGGIVSAFIGYILFILLEGFLLAVMGLISALVYNLIARLAGGVVIELEEEA